MPYTTPGFVVKQTFLELEDDVESAANEELGPAELLRMTMGELLPRMNRSYSDTYLTEGPKKSSKFGPEDMRLYWEEFLAREQAAAETETPRRTPPTRAWSPAGFRRGTSSGTSSTIHQSPQDIGVDLAGRLHQLQEDESGSPASRAAPGGSLRPDRRRRGSGGDDTPPHPRHALRAARAPSPRTEQGVGREHRSGIGEGARPEGEEQGAAFGRATTPASSSVGGPAAERTTVKLEGLPGEYTRPLLAELLDSEGFAGCYDFIYLPVDLRTRMGCGYALVNLRSHSLALRALEHFDGFASWRVRSTQACEAAWSQYYQGLDELVVRYRNSPIMHPAVPDIYKPAVFRGGAPAPLPDPTRRLRMPRLRKQGTAAAPGAAAAAVAPPADAAVEAAASGSAAAGLVEPGA